MGGASTVGLDIGTSAVRAVQVSTGRNGVALTSFGQEPLAPGAVVDGEIRDSAAVSDAVARLWKKAKLGPKKAVLGIANQNVVIRQIDLPFLEEKEFRSSIKFHVADHIPIPVDEAELDYEILTEYETDEGRMMRVLLVAASTQMVEGFVTAVADAGVQAVAIDVSPFAVARAVSAVARGDIGGQGAEAVIDIGAAVTKILVHENGEVQFVRILMVGGDTITEALAEELEIPFEEAEALKVDLGQAPGETATERVLSKATQAMVDEVGGSIHYYLSQEESVALNSVVVTGGGSLTKGLVEKLDDTLGQQTSIGAPLLEMETKKAGLNEDQLRMADNVVAAAVGLAIGSKRQ